MGERERGKRRPILKSPRVGIVLLAIVALLAFGAWRIYSSITRDLKSKLETILTDAFGRPVTVEHPILTRSLWIDRITVAGDPDMDSGPFLVLTGVRAWPNFLSLVRMNPTIDFVTVESSILNVRYSEEKGWNLKGLFPSPPEAEPRLGRLLMPRTCINFDANGQFVTRTVNVSIVLGGFGGYICRFNDERVKGRFDFTGGENRNPVYALTVALDSVPIMARAETVKLSTEFHESTRLVTFDLATSVRGTPARLAGALTFDSATVRSDSAFWEFGPHRGELVAAVDDIANRRFLLATGGTIEFDAQTLGERFSAGTIAVENASVQGGLKGEWEIKGRAHANGVTMGGDPSIEELSGDIDFHAALSETFQITPAKYTGSVRFARAVYAGKVLARGDARFEGVGRAITLTGGTHVFASEAAERSSPAPAAHAAAPPAPEPHATAYFREPPRHVRARRAPVERRAQADRSLVTLKNFKAAFNSKWELVQTGGGIRFAGIDPRELGLSSPAFSLTTLSVDMENLELLRDNDRWKVGRVAGLVDEAAGACQDAGFKIEKARVDITEGPRGFNGSFDGHVEGLGGKGSVNARLANSEVKHAEIKFAGLDVDAARKLKPSDALARLARHVRTLDIDGVADFTDGTPGEPAGLKFSGRAASHRCKLAPTDAAETPDNMHAVVLQADLFAPDDKRSPVILNDASLSIDDGRSKLSVSKMPIRTDQVQTRVTIDRLSCDHLKSAARTFWPNRFTEKLNIEGILKGTVDIDKRGDAYSAELNIAGNLQLRGTPLDFTVTGHITDKEPTILVNVARVSPEAIQQSMADLDSNVDRGVMEWKGTAGAALTVIGSWADFNVEGTLQFHDAQVRFPQRNIVFTNIDGEVPFRLQKAKLLALGELESKRLTIGKLTWADVVVRNIACQARFNEKSLHFDKLSYDFAEGRGRGAFVIDFPTWDHPRTAFGSRIEGCSVGIVYRTMQPFKGDLEGTATGQIELNTEGTEFTKLEADVSIESGLLGSELLKQLVLAKKEQGARPSVFDIALASLDVWYFDHAGLKLKFIKDYYSPRAAIGYLDDPEARDEIKAWVEITGPIKPMSKFTIMDRISPFGFIQVKETVRIENMPLYLFMHKVGRRMR